MKEKQKTIKLYLNAGKATSAPPLGPILSQYSINPINFCKEYNEKTKKDLGKIIPIKLNIYNDKSYTIDYLNPPISKLILNFLNLEKGSKTKTETLGYITDKIIDDIYQLKKNEFNSSNFIKIKNMILGTSKNMGILYVNIP